jgi:hypothetical protein
MKLSNVICLPGLFVIISVTQNACQKNEIKEKATEASQAQMAAKSTAWIES